MHWVRRDQLENPIDNVSKEDKPKLDKKKIMEYADDLYECDDKEIRHRIRALIFYELFREESL